MENLREWIEIRENILTEEDKKEKKEIRRMRKKIEKRKKSKLLKIRRQIREVTADIKSNLFLICFLFEVITISILLFILTILVMKI